MATTTTHSTDYNGTTYHRKHLTRDAQGRFNRDPHATCSRCQTIPRMAWRYVAVGDTFDLYPECQTFTMGGQIDMAFGIRPNVLRCRKLGAETWTDSLGLTVSAPPSGGYAYHVRQNGGPVPAPAALRSAQAYMRAEALARRLDD